MRYLGSKTSTTDSLYHILSERMPNGTFCDPFGGIGTVGNFFKSKGYSVWSGDILTNAHYFQVSRIQLQDAPSFRLLKKNLDFRDTLELLEYLNSTKRYRSWFEKEFSEIRNYFTLENSRKIAGCYSLIRLWSKAELINHNEKAFLISSLINSMDKVANTAGTYYAHLKHWYRKALRPFHFSLIDTTNSNEKCKAFLCDAKTLVAKRHFNILYLDPPYNERSYASYYHLPETIASLKTSKAFGASGIPEKVGAPSKFNQRAHAATELALILESSSFDILAFHYSDEGFIKKNEIRKLLRKYGYLEEWVLNSKGYSVNAINKSNKQRLYVVSNG